MRWYKIIANDQIWDATGDPNALNVEMDIPVAYHHAPAGGVAAWTRIWGIPLKTLLNANQFNNKPVYVYGGMQKGLPLANPAQQGLLVQGNGYPVVGNWVGTDMTIDFFIVFAAGLPDPPKAANVIHNWKANTPAKQAIQQTLSTAYPNFKINVNVSDKLKLNYDDTGFYQFLPQFAKYWYGISNSIMAGTKDYPGVCMWVKGNSINASDGTTPTSTTHQINFQDLIGQPIWKSPQIIQFKIVMRGDMDLGHAVILPSAMASLGQQSGTQFSGQAASNMIQGKFYIQTMRHVGNFRQPDWQSWCTIIDANIAPQPAAQ